MKNATQKIVISSLFAALICVATMLIKIPSPLKGYISGILSKLAMLLGYFPFEGILYGFVPSLVNIPANAVRR